MPESGKLSPGIVAARPAFSQEDIDNVLLATERVLKSGRMILGDYTWAFEDAFRNYVGTEHAVAVSSCTAALQIVLRFYRTKGREVVVPTNNFPGVVTAVSDEGGIPVLAGMDTTNFGLDVEDAIRRVTPQTAGMIVVHIAGLVCPQIERLRTFCRQNDLFLIEDASHAHGADIAGRRAGSLTDAACFSFYPTKILTTGTGGMITTDSIELAGFARSVRHHGQSPQRDTYVLPGNDWCLPEINAAIGLRQLAALDEHVQRRNDIVNAYRQRLQHEDWLTIPVCPPTCRHAYYKFPVFLAEGLDRNRMREALASEYRIENGTIYDPPCHRQPVFQELFASQQRSFPTADAALARQLCPPIHSTLTEDEIEVVVDAMKTIAIRLRHSS